MKGRPLDRIEIKGFRSIKNLDLTLQDVNVLIGPNGAGKSNFISFLQMMSALIRGRLNEYAGKAGGANAILHYGRKTTPKLIGNLYFGQNGYLFTLSATAEDRFIFEKEILHFSGIRYPGKDINLGGGQSESKAPATYKEKGDYSIPGYVVNPIRSWITYHFHDTSSEAPPKQSTDVHLNEILKPDGSNLAAFLYLLQEKWEGQYDQIRSSVQQVFPKFSDFVLRPEALNQDKIRLKWREKGSDHPFLADQLSDGTIRFICLATVLLQPSHFMPATMIIDEPELGLHPSSLTTLAELIQDAARRTQIIISTQSASLVDEFKADDIITVDREPGDRGASIFKRHSTEKLEYWLKEYSLSEVWEKNIIGGRP